MSLFFFEVLGKRNTGIPGFLALVEVIRVDKMIDLFLDGAGMCRNIILGEELLFLVIVDFLIAY